MSLTFKEFSEINFARSKEWHARGIGTLTSTALIAPWFYLDYSNAMVGEAGETANAVKKLRRYELGILGNRDRTSQSELIVDIGNEIGDTLVYLDLLASSLGLSLEECVRRKFNRKSIELGFEEML